MPWEIVFGESLSANPNSLSPSPSLTSTFDNTSEPDIYQCPSPTISSTIENNSDYYKSLNPVFLCPNPANSMWEEGSDDFLYYHYMVSYNKDVAHVETVVFLSLWTYTYP